MSESDTFENLFLNKSHKTKDFTYRISKRILVIDKVQGNFLFLNKLKEWDLKRKNFFDYIFCLGNFLKEKSHIYIKQGANFDEIDISAILNYFETISLNCIYIPGETDPISMFNINNLQRIPLSVKSKNINKFYTKLSDDLYVVGFSSKDLPTNDFVEVSLIVKLIKDLSRIIQFEYHSHITFILLLDIISLKAKNIMPDRDKYLFYLNKEIFNMSISNFSCGLIIYSGSDQVYLNSYPIPIISPGFLNESKFCVLELDCTKNQEKEPKILCKVELESLLY